MSSERPRTTHELVSEDAAGRERTDDTRGGESGSLISSERAADYGARWYEIQTDFVDSPRRAVEDADALVAELMRDVSDTLADQRDALERQLDRGESMDTEDLRTTLHRYREFFDRLLAT